METYYIAFSPIHGIGVFANSDLEEGQEIGLAHLIGGTRYQFTELGLKHNHSDTPNAHNIVRDGGRYLVASRPISIGEEITTDYRLQPELEQPGIDFEIKNQTT